MQTRTYHIEGMHCGGCSGRVKRLLERLPGVELADVDHVEGIAVLTVAPGTSVDDAEVAEVVQKAGYAVVP